MTDQYINCFSWHGQHTSTCQNCMFKHAFWYSLIHTFHKGTSPNNHMLGIGTTHWDHQNKNNNGTMTVVQYFTGGACRSSHLSSNLVWFVELDTLFCVALRWCSSTCRAALPIWFTHCSESHAFVSINQLHWPGDIDLINILLKLLSEYKNHIKSYQDKFRVFGTYLEKTESYELVKP